MCDIRVSCVVKLLVAESGIHTLETYAACSISFSGGYVIDCSYSYCSIAIDFRPPPVRLALLADKRGAPAEQGTSVRPLEMISFPGWIS
jgi:hypothetical protein